MLRMMIELKVAEESVSDQVKWGKTVVLLLGDGLLSGNKTINKKTLLLDYVKRGKDNVSPHC